MSSTDARPRRSLVTGGAGFVGSHLAEALVAAGDEVTLLDDLSTGRMENIAHLLDAGSVRFVRGDATLPEVVAEQIEHCDVVFHLAASLGVSNVVDNPVEMMRINVAATEAVLESARPGGVKVLVASTSEVYGKGIRVPFAEDDDVVIGPTSRSRWSYATSKMLDEFMTLGYHAEFGLPVVVFRLFNTVGPRQNGRYGMVIPSFVEAALSQRALPVHGDGEQSRCFMHVGDAVRAICSLAECDDAVGKVVNVGAGTPISIGRLAQVVLDRVQHRTGRSGGFIKNVPYSEAYGPGFEDMQRREPDTTRLRTLTGWAPTHDMLAILDDVIDSLTERVGA
ncbi:MAG: NAD-dependent epimerase/dehydratase family protein [Acidimicrobiales bacterium]